MTTEQDMMSARLMNLSCDAIRISSRWTSRVTVTTEATHDRDATR